MAEINKETLGQQAAITAVNLPESALFLTQRTDLGAGQKSGRSITPNELRKLIKNRDEVVEINYPIPDGYTLSNSDIGKILLFTTEEIDSDAEVIVPNGLNKGIVRCIHLCEETLGHSFDVRKVGGESGSILKSPNIPYSRMAIWDIFIVSNTVSIVTVTPFSSEADIAYLRNTWDNTPTGSVDAYPLHAGTLLEKIEEAIGATGWYTIASQGEAEAGTENTKQMTPLRVAQAIAALAGGSGVQNNWSASVDPVATNDTTEGYAPGSSWFNSVGGDLFRCTDATEDAAVWVNVTGLSLGDLASVAISGSAADLSDLVSYLASQFIFPRATNADLTSEAPDRFLTPALLLDALGSGYLEYGWDSQSSNTFDPSKLNFSLLFEYMSADPRAEAFVHIMGSAPSTGVSGNKTIEFDEGFTRRYVLSGDTDFSYNGSGVTTLPYAPDVTAQLFLEIDNSGGHAMTWADLTWLTPEPSGTGVFQILIIHNVHDAAADSIYAIDLAASGQMTGSQIETVLDTYFGSAAWRTIADQTEAEAGAINTKFMTPLRVAQAIAAQAGSGGTLGLPHVFVANTNRDLEASDIDKLILVHCTTQDVNLSVPAGLSDAFACMVKISSQLGGYKCTITENGGSIVGGEPIILEPKDPILIKHIGSDEFEIYGNEPSTFGLRTETGTSATATETDNDGIIEMNNAGANSVEFPADGTENLPIGFSTTVVQVGAGATTITFESPASGSSKNGFVLDGQGAAAVVYKRGSNDYRVIGELIT